MFVSVWQDLPAFWRLCQTPGGSLTAPPPTPSLSSCSPDTSVNYLSAGPRTANMSPTTTTTTKHFAGFVPVRVEKGKQNYYKTVNECPCPSVLRHYVWCYCTVTHRPRRCCGLTVCGVDASVQPRPKRSLYGKVRRAGAVVSSSTQRRAPKTLKRF